MRVAIYDTSLTSKRDLLILRILCSFQVFMYLTLSIVVLVALVGMTGLIKLKSTPDPAVFLWVMGVINFILTILIVWVKKWYPIVYGEEKLK